jgi:4-carboxymuconolactone decarboxylase
MIKDPFRGEPITNSIQEGYMPKLPRNYLNFQKRFPDLVAAQGEMGRLAKEAGPIDAKTCHLLQLAACIAMRSEGGVHSHVRRALEAGATKDEIFHTAALLISTVGFPATAAAFSWISDIVEKKR